MSNDAPSPCYLVTFDLINASAGDYDLARRILAIFYLHPHVLTESDPLGLPNTTYLGHARSVRNAHELRVMLVEEFTKAGFTVGALVAAEVVPKFAGWSVWGPALR